MLIISNPTTTLVILLTRPPQPQFLHLYQHINLQTALINEKTIEVDDKIVTRVLLKDKKPKLARNQSDIFQKVT